MSILRVDQEKHLLNFVIPFMHMTTGTLKFYDKCPQYSWYIFIAFSRNIRKGNSF